MEAKTDITTTVRRVQVAGDASFHDEFLTDRVAAEEPLEIRMNGAPVAVLMRTPGADAALAAGFLLTEQLILRTHEIVVVKTCSDEAEKNVVDVVTRDRQPPTLAPRHAIANSSCGLCGKTTIESIHRSAPPFSSAPEPAAFDTLIQWPAKLRSAQPIFQRTGGLHAAALCLQDGADALIFEDIGRHNAVDKCIGHALVRGAIPTPSSVLLVSGRISFEIVQKALVARVATVMGLSAPTSLALELARASKMCVVGFLGPKSFVIYTE